MGLGFNISGEYLDLYPDTDVVYDYAPNDFSELNTRQGITSADFSVPRTAKNERLLQERTVSAILESEGGSRFEGFLRVYKRISFQNESISVFFTSSNTEWISLINGRSIREADLSRYNHLSNINTVVQSFNNTEGFIYPLIDYGNAEQKASFQFFVSELAPAVYAKTLLLQIFQDIGIAVEGTLLDNVSFGKAILPFSGQDIPLFYQDINSLLGVSATFSGVPVQDLAFNSLRYSVSDAVDLVNNRIDNVSPFDILVQVTATKFIDGASPNYTIEVVDSNGLTTSLISKLGNNSETVQVFIPASGFIRFRFTVPETGTGDLVVLLDIAEVEKAVEGTVIDVSRSLPDISQADFLQYIFFTFGVLAQYDVISKTITLNQYKDLEANKSRAINVSDRVDLSIQIEQNFDEVSEGYSQVNELNYSNDNSDDLLEDFEELNNKPLGFGTLTIDNPQLVAEGSLYEAPFAGTFNRPTFLQTIGFDQPPYIPSMPRLDSYSGEAVEELEPRILLVELDFDFGQELEIAGTIGFSQAVDTAPLAYFVKSVLTPEYNEINASLSYSNFGVIAPNDTPIIESELAIIQRILTTSEGLSIYLDYELEEIQRIDFSVPLYLELEDITGYYFISKIENINGISHSYKFDLVKLD